MLLESIDLTSREVALGLVDRNRQLLEYSSRHPYKITSDGTELATHVFLPENWAATDRRSAIVFFHSSQWDQGNITQFAPHAVFFAARGAVCVLAEYRMGASSGAAPLEAMADARSAIRWLRTNSGAFGIDSEKLVASGGSCGAHAAVSAAVCGEEFDDAGEDACISCVPNALVLFAPALDISPRGVYADAFADAATAKKASPLRNVRPQLSPMLIFHGSMDACIPIKGSQKFAKKMQRKKNRCELHEFGGQPHSFFNFNVNDQLYQATVDVADDFLVSLGMLDEMRDRPPTIYH